MRCYAGVVYRFKCALRNLFYGPPPTMKSLTDWLDPEKVKANAAYPWFAEEWRQVALDYARAYADLLSQKETA